jgi:hypothetical protein
MDTRARHLLRRALSAGRTREALALAEHAIAEEGSDGETRALAAMAEAELGCSDAACDRLVAAAGIERGRLWLRDAALLLIRRAPAGEQRLALAQRLSAGVSDPSGTLLLAHAECLIGEGRFEDAAARVELAASAEARMVLATRLAMVGDRLRASRDRRASRALDATLRLLPFRGAPKVALQAAQLAAALGRFGDVIGLLRDASGSVDALAGGEAILARIFNAACDTGELEAARQVLDLMPSSPEPMRMRCAVALVDAGRLEAAASLAAALTTPAPRAEMAERLLRAAGDGPLLPLLEGLLLGPGLPFRVLLRVLAAAGRRGELNAATSALRAAPSGDGVEREMAEVALLWVRGDLGSARRRLDDSLTRSPEDARLLRAAFDAARQTPDPPAAAKLAAKLAATLDDDEAIGVFWILASAMAGEGLENDARTLLRRVQAALRRLVDNPGNADVGLLYTAFRTALDIYDARTARQLVGHLPDGHVGAAIWAKVEAVIARDDEVATFAQLARTAFAAASDDAAAVEDADLQLVVPPCLLPATDIPAGGAPARSVERTAGRQAMVRVLDLAPKKGLVTRIAPSLGYHIPDAVRGARGTFASWHSFGDIGRGVHLKAGPLPDTLLIDAGGYSGWSRIAKLDLPAIPLGMVDGALGRAWRVREV